MTIAISKECLRLSQDLQALTGENALLCYQCKKCTLGCPSAYAMRMKPHELMRAIQLGAREEVYWSGTLGICLSCETCNTRCPQGINILRLIDGLRELAKRSEYYNPFPAIPAMQRAFLALIKQFGRIYPLGLALLTHLQMLAPFKDIDLASPLLKKGRLWIFPRKTRGVKELRRVMSRLRTLEQKEQKGWKALNAKE
jgi:heterodisulfide reductase subunit C